MSNFEKIPNNEEWLDSIRSLFKYHNIEFEEDNEFFIYPLELKDGVKIKRSTPKSKNILFEFDIDGPNSGKHKEILKTIDVIKMELENAKKFDRNDFSISNILKLKK